MGEKIIEISELEKTLTGFQRIPKGDVNTAYVFFQSKDNTKYIISTERKKVMTAELRLGKYDRIMTIHRGEFTEKFQREIACKENGHSFLASVDLRYFITDPQTIYLNRIHDISGEISVCLSAVEDE